jgi:hypothetical protein
MIQILHRNYHAVSPLCIFAAGEMQATTHENSCRFPPTNTANVTQKCKE